jgi:catechol 2,3-dioxygenase-like lactoylglutathione lyase family enzyme
VSAPSKIRLHHLGFGVPDPRTTAALLQKAFELDIASSSDAHVDLLIGGSVLKLYDVGRCQGEASDRLPARYVALTVPVSRFDGEAWASGAAGTLHAVGGPADARVLDRSQWSGVSLLVTSEAPAVARPGSAERNVRGIDHIGVASQDNSLARDQFSGVLGLEVESEQTDTEVLVRVEQFVSTRHGFRSVSNTVADRSSGLRVLFVTLPPVDFEFLQDLGGRPAESGGGGGSTFGDKSAIGKYVDKRGPGVHHVALRVADIDAAIARASSAGLQMIDGQARPGSRRADIAFVHPSSAGSILWHFVQR